MLLYALANQRPHSKLTETVSDYTGKCTLVGQDLCPDPQMSHSRVWPECSTHLLQAIYPVPFAEAGAMKHCTWPQHTPETRSLEVLPGVAVSCLARD